MGIPSRYDAPTLPSVPAWCESTCRVSRTLGSAIFLASHATLQTYPRCVRPFGRLERRSCHSSLVREGNPLRDALPPRCRTTSTERPDGIYSARSVREDGNRESATGGTTDYAARRCCAPVGRESQNDARRWRTCTSNRSRGSHIPCRPARRWHTRATGHNQNDARKRC